MKKVISVLLTFVMLIGLVSVAFAKEEISPVIVVSGMGTDQYEIDENGEKTTVWPPSAENIVKAVVKLAPALVKVFKDDDYSTIGQSLTGVKELFEPLACDENGALKRNITTDLYPLSISEYPDDFDESCTECERAICRSIGDEIGYENSYFFNYTWSRNPMEIADDLEEYIDGVISQTGAKKVSIIACSMGGTITMSYLYKYGTAKLKNVVLASTAFLGTEIVGQLFNKDVRISVYDALTYFSEFLGYDFVQTLIVLAKKAITEKDDEILGTADAFVDKIVSNLKDVAFSDVFLDTYVAMPGIWALMPNSYYEGAKETLITDKSGYLFLEDGENSIDVYMNCVQSKAADIIAGARTSGVNVYITATYFCPGIPVQNDASNYTDNLIDVKYAGGYATVAKYGETLDCVSGTVCADLTHSHLSPDAVIDASSCILPEQTWFIKNVAHMGYEYGTELCGLLTYLSTSDEEVSIFSNEKYPQFTKFDKVTKELSSEFENDTSKETSTFAMLLIELIKKLVKFLYSFLSVRGYI